MYLLPEKLELDDLIGQRIDGVTVGAYTATFGFEKGLILQVEYKVESEINGIKTLWFDEEWKDTSQISQIGLNTISSIQRTSDTEFKILLSNGLSLCFYTEESPYECINITKPNGDLQVI